MAEVWGAAVVLNGRGHSYELTTDENGHASEVLFPEKYDVEIVKEEYDALTTEVSAQDGGIVVDQIEIKKSKKTVGYPEEALRVYNECLSNYIFVELIQENDSRNQTVKMDIILSDAEKIRAAALVALDDRIIDNYFRNENGRIVLDANAETGPNGNGYHGKSLSKEDIEDKCEFIFGTRVKWDELQTKQKCNLYDAIKYTDASGTYPLLLDAEIDSEIDIESHTYKVTEGGDGYIGEVEFYWGYWGTLSKNPGLSNYVVTYGLKPDDKSPYGVVISSMAIEEIGNNSEVTEKNEPESTGIETHNSPFYGVWCSASKSESETQKVADRLTELGLNGKVYISSDWSNLNPEKWYCASAGTCRTKSEAESVLQVAKKAGYTDAYIKYSGNYLR